MAFFVDAKATENIDLFASVSYGRAVCAARRFSAGYEYSGDWNSDVLGALAGMRFPVNVSADGSLVLAPVLALSFSSVWNGTAEESGGIYPMVSDAQAYESFCVLSQEWKRFCPSPNR